MNSSVYLFGRLIQGYTQYPNDHTQSIFQEFASKATAKTQIAIHRENNLMYYGYVRLMDLKQSQYLGMCVVLNDLMINDIKSLFNLFENIFTTIVANGYILKLDENGNIISNVAQVNEQQNETERILSLLQNSVASLDDKSVKLPPVSYGISSSEVKKFTISDPVEDIIDASHKYSYAIIYKDKGYDTNTLKGYKGVIIRLRNEKNELNEKLQKLSVDYNKVLREKKRSTLVSILSACIILFMIIGYTIVQKKDNIISAKNTTISNTEALLKNREIEAADLKQNNEYKDKIISKQKFSINNKNLTIETLNDSISNLNIEIANQRLEISSLLTAISRLNRENSNTQNYYSSTDSNENMTGKSVRVYTAAPLLANPYSDARVIERMYGDIYVLYKENDEFYRVKYKEQYGYVSKYWIRKVNN